VALSYDRAAVKLYVDGALAGERPYDEAIKENPFDLLIGEGFAGLIDEVQISGGALGAEAIARRARE
jgi:hypothetical protein